MSKLKGSILILVLWLLCLLSTFAVILGNQIRQKILFIQRFEERDKLAMIAEAGIERATIQILKEDKKDYHCLKDPWSNNPNAFKDIAVGDGRFNISYSITDQAGDSRIRWGLIDEQRKININNAEQAVLKRLFRIVLAMEDLEAQDLAASIIDWRDSDNLLSTPSGSAEDRYYMGLKYPYRAKNSNFDVLEELLLIKGVNNNIFEKLKDYITIYGDGRVNINTASKPVLLALGLKDSTVDKILAFRSGEDEVEATCDDNVFDLMNNIVPKFSGFCFLSVADSAQLQAVAESYLCTTSNYFMIYSTAQTNNGRSFRHIVSVIDRLGNVFYWQQS